MGRRREWQVKSEEDLREGEGVGEEELGREKEGG